MFFLWWCFLWLFCFGGGVFGVVSLWWCLCVGVVVVFWSSNGIVCCGSKKSRQMHSYLSMTFFAACIAIAYIFS